MALHIAPPTAHPSSTTTTSTHQTPLLTAPSVPGLADTLRTPAPPSAPTPSSSHPLEARLVRWKTTRDELKMQGLRRTYGIAEPVRREMELAGVRAGDGMGFTGLRTGGGGKSVSEEVLRGEEAEMGGWEGVFGTGEELREGDFHGEMEAKSKMNW